MIDLQSTACILAIENREKALNDHLGLAGQYSYLVDNHLLDELIGNYKQYKEERKENTDIQTGRS